jgi:endonuclease-3 related protein
MSFADVYNILSRHYGPQQWWPGETPFEVMVGAILTQNTAWTNVEKAISKLQLHNALTPERITSVSQEQLAEWIRPSGYFNIKATRLKNYCDWYLQQGGFEPLDALDTRELRHRVLSVNGVGPETADDILLYAFGRGVFVIDAYTRRLFSRLELVNKDAGYEHLREQFERFFNRRRNKADLFNEYHALIVIHAKSVCRKRPLCSECCLAERCPSYTE